MAGRELYITKGEVFMKELIGYLVKNNGEIIGATADIAEALEIAKRNKAICYKVVTIVKPKENSEVTRTVIG